MLSQVTIFRSVGRGRNAEVLDVLERLAEDECGSAVNAALVCSRESPRFRAMLKRVRGEREAAPAGEPAKATG